MNESMYEEACEYYEIVETTQGMNGYPRNLRKAVIGFDCIGEAEEFANHHKGKVVELCKRDGWLCLEELVEVNPSAGFERGETIHYKEKFEVVNGQEIM